MHSHKTKHSCAMKPLDPVKCHASQGQGPLSCSFLNHRSRLHQPSSPFAYYHLIHPTFEMNIQELSAPTNAMEPGAAIRDVSHSTTVNLEGYQYTRAWLSQRKVAYRCRVYRSTECRGKAEFVAAIMQYMNVEEHTCRRDAVAVPETIDITRAMQSAVDELALGDFAMATMQIWHQVDARFYQGTEVIALRGLTQHQVLGGVYRTRAQHISGNIHGRIEVPPLSRVLGQPLNLSSFTWSAVSAMSPRPNDSSSGSIHTSLLCSSTSVRRFLLTGLSALFHSALRSASS